VKPAIQAMTKARKVTPWLTTTTLRTPWVRKSSMAANIPFIKANLSPLSFTSVPRSTYTDAILGIYELNAIGRQGQPPSSFASGCFAPERPIQQPHKDSS
jgi:hypothetical protein